MRAASAHPRPPGACQNQISGGCGTCRLGCSHFGQHAAASTGPQRRNNAADLPVQQEDGIDVQRSQQGPNIDSPSGPTGVYLFFLVTIPFLFDTWHHVLHLPRMGTETCCPHHAFHISLQIITTRGAEPASDLLALNSLQCNVPKRHIQKLCVLSCRL